MNLITLQPSGMMLIGILSTILISSTKSAPVTYTSYAGKDSLGNPPQLLLLVDQWIPELEKEMYNGMNESPSTVSRTKRIGSLSIVNSLDVLRERVLLELARKKALQDQRQIDANRRFLETIGKRSVRPFNNDVLKDVNGRIRSGLEYSIEQHGPGHQNGLISEKMSARAQDWLDSDDPVFRERQQDEARRMQTNELRLL